MSTHESFEFEELTPAPPRTKRIAIAVVRLDIEDGAVVETQLPAPCRVLRVFGVREAVGIVVTKESQRSRSVPHLVVEIDPDGPKVRRQFLALAAGMACDLDKVGGELEYGDTWLNPDTGKPVCIYHWAMPEEGQTNHG